MKQSSGPRPIFLIALAAVILLAVWRRKDIMETLNIVKKLAHGTNYGKGRTAKIDTIVIHTTAGGFQSAVDWFAMDHGESGASSAHYTIGKKGQIAKSVEEKDTAWHASDRGINARSIGIELEGMPNDPNNFTPAMMATTIALCRDLVQRYGIPVKKGVPGFIGHVDVKYARETQGKTDPGPYFPWDSFLASVRGGGVPMV